MNNKHTAVIAVLVLVILFLGLALLYVALRPLHAVAPAPTASSTPSEATTTAAMAPQSLNESGQYYDVSVAYPAATPLAQSAGVQADAAAVAAMHDALAADIAQFKKDANLGNLTATDISTLGLDQGRKYSFSATYTTYQGPHTVSYVFQLVEDTLGAHPNTTYQTFTFDRATGAPLTLGDLFSDTAYLKELSTLARADLPKIIAAQQGSTADTSMLQSGTTPNSDSFQTWYFDGSSFVLLFPPYQVGPYALGTVKDRIALPRLTDLKAQYR